MSCISYSINTRLVTLATLSSFDCSHRALIIYRLVSLNPKHVDGDIRETGNNTCFVVIRHIADVNRRNERGGK